MESYPTATFPHTAQAHNAAVQALRSDDACGLDHEAIEDLADAHGRAFILALMQDHLDLRAKLEAVDPVPMEGADGVVRTEVRPSPRRLSTKWGDVTVRRLALWKRGASGGLRPLDAALNLPVGQHSHGVQREVAWGVAQGSYDAVIENMRRTTSSTIGKRQAEDLVVKLTADFEEFYLDRPRGPSPNGNRLMVLTFDGSGVVMREEGLRPGTRKRAQKERRKRSTAEQAAMGTPKDTQPHRKRMAEVAAVYSLDVVSRTPEDVLRALRRSGPHRPRPRAEEKRAWASVERSIPDILDEAFTEAVLRDERFERRWVSVVDGNEEQLRHIEYRASAYGVEVTVVIDFIHVLGKLWEAGKAILGSKAPIADVEKWVDQRAERVLRGQSSLVAAAIRRSGTRRRLRRKKREAVDKCCDYLLKHRDRLRYHEFLRDGLPIASGVIEGACRSLVKDRMDITGARWGLHGAEAVLKLRSLRASGDLDEYLDYHFRRQLERVHLAQFADTELTALRDAA
jgi:hypothetical protein